VVGEVIDVVGVVAGVELAEGLDVVVDELVGSASVEVAGRLESVVGVVGTVRPTPRTGVDAASPTSRSAELRTPQASPVARAATTNQITIKTRRCTAPCCHTRAAVNLSKVSRCS